MLWKKSLMGLENKQFSEKERFAVEAPSISASNFWNKLYVKSEENYNITIKKCTVPLKKPFFAALLWGKVRDLYSPVATDSFHRIISIHYLGKNLLVPRHYSQLNLERVFVGFLLIRSLRVLLITNNPSFQN